MPEIPIVRGTGEWERYQEYELDPDDTEPDNKRVIMKHDYIPQVLSKSFTLEEKVNELKQLLRHVTQLRAEIIQLETDFGLDSGEDVAKI